MNNHFGITNLDENLLSDLIPTRTFAGGATPENPSDWLVIWRTTATQRARGATLGFFLSDDRLEPLWSRPERYSTEFRLHGVGAVVEPDFSLWVDDSIETQLHNIKRKKIVARQWQESGLRVAPCLNWASEESFAFCFSGVPVGCPVAFVECRTAGGNDSDRRAFFKGLEQAVKQVQPQHVLIYGGKEHSYWLAERLPAGPTYTLLEAWTSARGKIRATEKRIVRAKNQLQLFGGEAWVEEAAPAA
jgi:hypothetical protein